MKLKVLGLIPARGGSKGIPRKNIKILGDKPLIGHTIEAAKKSGILNRIIVSTDDSEIAEVAKDYGAQVPFIRPKQFATDTASSLSVVKHAVDWFKGQGDTFDAVAVLAPTSPLRTGEHICGVVKLLASNNLDSAVTIVKVEDHPYFVFEKQKDGRLEEMIKMSDKPLRRQELPDYFTHSQAVIVSRTNYLNKCADNDPIFNFKSMAGYEIPRQNALDIDTPMDFQLAQMFIKSDLNKS